MYFWTKLSSWRKNWTKQDYVTSTLKSLVQNFTVVITIWLAVTKYPYLKWQWIVYFLCRFSPLSPLRLLSDLTKYIWVTRRVSYEKLKLLTIREHPGSLSMGSVFNLLVPWCVFIFGLSLPCVLCAQCSQCLWTVYSLTFFYFKLLTAVSIWRSLKVKFEMGFCICV